MQVTEKRSNKDRVLWIPPFVAIPVLRRYLPKENLHGAYLAYTRRRTREPKAGKGGGTTVRGGKDGRGGGKGGQGRKKTQGRNPLQR